MIGYIEGLITYLAPELIHIDINGLGYEVNITLHTYEAIKEKKEVKLFTKLIIKEDEWLMFGFYDLDEKKAFIKLTTVSGIGPNTARIILSTLNTQQLHQIIEAGDSKSFEKIKGIGAKTAQRIILELKGKLDFKNLTSDKDSAKSYNTNIQDALSALVGLGISKNVAEKAIDKIDNSQDMRVEEIIKLALKNI